MKKTRIWGTIQHELGYAVPYVYVLLLRKIQHNRQRYYKVIAKSYADQQGCYSFDVPSEKESVYKVVVIWNQ